MERELTRYKEVLKRGDEEVQGIEIDVIATMKKAGFRQDLASVLPGSFYTERSKYGVLVTSSHSQNGSSLVLDMVRRGGFKVKQTALGEDWVKFLVWRETIARPE